MENDIVAFANNIRDNTGIGFDVYSADGEFIAGEDKGAVRLDFDGIYADAERSRTLFRFRYKSKNYVGAIAGVNSASQNYAYLICELAEQSYSKSNLSKEEFSSRCFSAKRIIILLKNIPRNILKAVRLALCLFLWAAVASTKFIA